MGILIDEIQTLLREHLRQHGVVVWFDPERAYTAILEREGITTNRRMHRGRGVMGACGQLGDTLKTCAPATCAPATCAPATCAPACCD